MGATRTTLRVRVTPRAARVRLALDENGVLRAHLTAPPVEGAANRALIAALADRLGVPKRDVTIVRGDRGREKLVAVAGRTQEEITRALAGEARSDVDRSNRRG